jgi:hypothetical protein
MLIKYTLIFVEKVKHSEHTAHYKLKVMSEKIKAKAFTFFFDSLKASNDNC